MSNAFDSSLPNLEQLRMRAKELIRAHRSHDASATERLKRHVPKLATLSVAALQEARLSLADAQHVLAREQGFESWPRMVRELELARDAAGGLLTAALVGDAALVERTANAATLAQSSLHLACALADVEAVRASTADVNERWGRLDAPPLIYLCSARLGQGDAEYAARRLEIAKLLIARGADADARYADLEHFDGERLAISAAAKNVGSVDLLRVLVEAGANKHDHSALWATADLDHPVDDDPLACLKYMLSQRPPQWMLVLALSHSVRRDSLEAVQLLLDMDASPDHGGGWGGSGTLLHHCILADSDARIRELLFRAGDRKRLNREGKTPLEIARLIGHRAAQQQLEELGETAPKPSENERALHAALGGDAATVAQFAGRKLKFERGEHQLLIWALQHGRTDAIEHLLSIGIDPNTTDDNGRSALVVAQEAKRTEAARRLAAAGARLASVDYDVAPDAAFEAFEAAAEAIAQGDLATLRRLLDEHEDLVRWRSPRPHRATLLHYIGANGLEATRQKTPPCAVEVLQLLLERGAEPDALSATYGGGPAQTTLALLASSDHPARAGLQADLVQALCAGGANPNGIDEDGLPLATAISFTCPDAMKGLVASGARVDNIAFAAALGRTDLLEDYVASDGTARAGSLVCRVDWFWPSNDPRLVAGYALVLAARFDQREAVRFLIERGVDLTATPLRGETALHTAAYNGRAEVARMLLEAGADATLRDQSYSSTPFGWALEGKRDDVIEVLLEFARPCLTDAVDIGLVEHTRRHLEEDPSQVDAPEGRGGLLLWSAHKGRTDMVRLLLEYGARRDVRNSAGKTPRELALAAGHDAVVALLDG